MSTTFPRSQNGYEDDGAVISMATDTCPNCGSLKYRQTVSTEDCSACGLHCDYWGAGANEVYKAMMERKAQEEATERRCQEDEEMPAEQIFYDLGNPLSSWLS